MADNSYNRVSFEGRANFEGTRGLTWYKNTLGVYMGKNKEGKAEYFNATFFLDASQFDLIPHIEGKGKIRVVGMLKANKYVDKNGLEKYNLQVAYPEVTAIEDVRASESFSVNDFVSQDDYSDDMEPF